MAYSDYEDEWNEGHPFLASLIGCAILIAGGWFGLPWLPPAPLPVIMAGAMVVAGLLWGLAYLITIRHATANWKLLSFMLLLITAAGVGYTATWIAEQRIKADLRTLMEMELDRDGFPRFAPGAENRGPISKLYIAFVHELVDGQHALDAEAEKAGIRLLADASALKANPKLLSDCTKVATVKQAANAMLERRRTRFKDLVQALQHTDYPMAYKRGIIEGLTGDDTDDNLVQMESLQARILDAAQGACTVLARRRWIPQGPVFMFTNNADLEAFSAWGQRQNEANAELQRLQAASRVRLQEGQRKMRQAMGKSLM